MFFLFFGYQTVVIDVCSLGITVFCSFTHESSVSFIKYDSSAEELFKSLFKLLGVWTGKKYFQGNLAKVGCLAWFTFQQCNASKKESINRIRFFVIYRNNLHRQVLAMCLQLNIATGSCQHLHCLRQRWSIASVSRMWIAEIRLLLKQRFFFSHFPFS